MYIMLRTISRYIYSLRKLHPQSVVVHHEMQKEQKPTEKKGRQKENEINLNSE